MVPTARRAVITGLGLISPIGADPQAFWASLLAGRTGIRAISSFDTTHLPVRIAGEVTDFNPKQYLDRKYLKQLRVWSRSIQLGVSAAQCAMNDSGLSSGMLNPDRFGVVFGTSLMATELDDLGPAAMVSSSPQTNLVDLSEWGKRGIPEIPPLWMLKYLPNMPACHVSIQHDARGPNNSITQGEIASLLAMGEAFRILGRGGVDFFLVGGCESKINPLSMVRHCLFQTLCSNNDNPEQALRPFDRHRTGTVLGEGSAVFGLEQLASAQKRDAKIYAEVVGFAAGFDRERQGGILARVIAKALADAGITPSDVDHINAHGLGTLEDDRLEARAIAHVFGECQPMIPVVAPKSSLGNLGAAGSVSELAASILALQHGILPGTLNHDLLDPDCPIAVHRGEPRPIRSPYVLKISFTDKGQCAALVIRRWDH